MTRTQPSKSLTPLEQVELKLLGLIGIRRFRDILLWIEKLQHRKKGDINKNYHLDSLSGKSVGEYKRFLRYNASFHVNAIIVLLAGIIYIRITDCFSGVSAPIKIVIGSFVLLVFLFNLYCLLLQRYNALRVRRCLQTYMAKKAKRIDHAMEVFESIIPFIYTRETARDDATRIDSILAELSSRKTLFLSKEDYPMLDRIDKAVTGLNNPYTYISESYDHLEQCTIGDLVRQSRYSGNVYGKVECRADALSGNGSRLLHIEAIVTEDKPSEEMFRHLFGLNPPAKILERFEALTLALRLFENEDA